MIKLWTAEEQAGFGQKLAACRRAVLFFDYDGTLAPIVPDRDNALPFPGVREAFERLLAIKHCRTVLVSGRRVMEIQPLLQSRLPFEAWGSHGCERLRVNGQLDTISISDAAQEGLQLAAAKISGLLGEQAIERKPNCVAAHVSNINAELMPQYLMEIEELWEPVAEEFGLELLDFHEGMEMRVPGINKSRVVTSVLSEEPKDAVTAYLGDDITDEDAFRVLDEQSHTILIGREKRPSAAQWLLPMQPDGRHIIDFLHATASALL
ncbi:trehalose-phosphatase [Halodesulfovibrio marinisediminis]|uniref:Trehalose 6-phosphate phosphatase n=1 Tax=Halodesulfovibrio marinisediminis DSM 17456 TaxID=1121457 RepID=A0A1N6DYE1_9BACT|nr:trehalose-phosphatase [Halodesulfovibrio marinisediminis]SIN75717.1 trehalose 6-phosphatase [Halodesulfovibrio marinisediminis DSM 17456]